MSGEACVRVALVLALTAQVYARTGRATLAEGLYREAAKIMRLSPSTAGAMGRRMGGLWGGRRTAGASAAAEHAPCTAIRAPPCLATPTPPHRGCGGADGAPQRVRAAGLAVCTTADRAAKARGRWVGGGGAASGAGAAGRRCCKHNALLTPACVLPRADAAAWEKLARALHEEAPTGGLGSAPETAFGTLDALTVGGRGRCTCVL